jgi:hypothetical protein
MHKYSLVHVRDEVLLRDLAQLVAHDRGTTAALLAHIAEVDVRRLFAPAGYSSMHAYCIEELRLSEDAAAKRIQAARAARKFPALFEALAEGRLHLTAVCLLVPYCTAENVEGLIEAATHRRKAEIQELVALRFPPPGAGSDRTFAVIVPVRVQHASAHVEEPGHGKRVVDPAQFTLVEHAPAPIDESRPNRFIDETPSQVTLDEHAPAHVDDVRAEREATPPERFLLKLTISKTTREKLRSAQALLSHAVPTGDVAQVLDRALDALITKLEKRKFGASPRSREPQPSSRKRHIPAPIRRAVWERDRGQCTFVGTNGHRCSSRRFLEFDHVEPVARGGKATVEGIRLRCRAHNQLEAERVFGAGFMAAKREEAGLAPP